MAALVSHVKSGTLLPGDGGTNASRRDIHGELGARDEAGGVGVDEEVTVRDVQFAKGEANQWVRS